MKLQEIYKGSRIIETIDNYALVSNNRKLPKKESSTVKANTIYDESYFWGLILKQKGKAWYKRFSFHGFVISEWIARVPGLFYDRSSESFRKVIGTDIAEIGGNYIELFPNVKSRIVSRGGIGTFLLSPDDQGRRLVSITSSGILNASTGIPILLEPEVWETLKPGNRISVENVQWQPLSEGWAKRFTSTNNIPRGCFHIKNTKGIKAQNINVPVQYHPVTIMEYERNAALFYDYVYVSAVSKGKNVKKDIETFFKNYAKKDGRNGRYLINPDLINPIFEAQYMSPAEMLDPSEKAKLELLRRRIANTSFSSLNLTELIEILPKYYDSELAIKRLGKNVGVNPSLLKEDSAANMSAQLINYCLETNKIEELVDRMSVEYSSIFNH